VLADGVFISGGVLVVILVVALIVFLLR